MSEFTVRAESLVDRITAEPSDASVQQELDALRALWRTLSEAERADAAEAAQAIAQARRRPPSPSRPKTRPPRSWRSRASTGSTSTPRRSAGTTGRATPTRC